MRTYRVALGSRTLPREAWFGYYRLVAAGSAWWAAEFLREALLLDGAMSRDEVPVLVARVQEVSLTAAGSMSVELREGDDDIHAMTVMSQGRVESFDLETGAAL